MPRTAVVIAIAAMLSLLLFVRVPGQGLWYDVALNASHGPIFAVVATLLWMMHAPAARTGTRAYVNVFFVAVGLGILIEILQTLARRPGSPFDVMTDAAGAAVGLGLCAWVDRRRSGVAGSWWPVAIVLTGITLVAWPPLQAARAYAHRASHFPVIAEFRAPRDLKFVTTEGTHVDIVELPAPWARRRGETALRLGFDAQHTAAVQVVEPAPDWRDYSVVAVDLTNASGADVRMTLRIHDAIHDWTHRDRMNLPLVLTARTRTTVRVALAEVQAAPVSRSMDLSRIANVMLFGKPAVAAGDIYVSRIWLE